MVRAHSDPHAFILADPKVEIGIKCAVGLFDFFKSVYSSKKTILVIDDDPVFLETTIAALRACDYKTLSAKGGREGMRLALQKKPSLVILDINMPEMDGWDVLAGLRSSKAAAKIPILMLTTVNQMGDVNRSFELGANGYIIKPLNTAQLYKKVDGLLKK